MGHEIKRLNEPGSRITIEMLPDKCPLCHRGCTPDVLGFDYVNNQEVTGVFRCPAHPCRALFLGRYRNNAGKWYLAETSPRTPKPFDLPKQVQEISPDAATLLNEAEAAIGYGLTSVVGPGLRKSLEFLIKDYLTKKEPAKKTLFQTTALGNCIKDHVDDAKVKRAATLATWLGNDETHYVRKWTDHDISDLRRLIHLTINWIDSDLTLQRYENEMQN